MTNDDKFAVKRRSSRKAVTTGAAISLPQRAEEHLPCVVRDVSQDGAQLILPQQGDLPKNFWLQLDGETEPHFCTLAWRSAQRLGVEFSQQITERRIAERMAFAAL
jgi:hypothetical protein